MDPLQRIMSRAVPFVDCLIYTGTPSGPYGKVWFDGREEYAHRVVFEAAFGPIPEHLVVDHICFTTKCVNVEHLRLLDRNINANRRTVPHHNAAKTHCPQGHAYTPSNTHTYRGRRSCIACREERRHQRAAA